MSKAIYRIALDRLLDGAKQHIVVENGELSSKPAFLWMKYGAPVEIMVEQPGVSETGCNLYFNKDLACCNTRSVFPVGGWEVGEDPEGFYNIVMASIHWVVDPKGACAIFLGPEEEPKDPKEEDVKVHKPVAKWPSQVLPPSFFNPEEY
jgi:hypothetical protein